MSLKPNKPLKTGLMGSNSLDSQLVATPSGVQVSLGLRSCVGGECRLVCCDSEAVVQRDANTKLSASYVATPTCEHDLWVVTERIRWIQAAEMTFLSQVCGRLVRDSGGTLTCASYFTWTGSTSVLQYLMWVHPNTSLLVCFGHQQANHAEKVISEEHEKENALEADSKIQILYPGRGHTQVISE